jgi:prophage antirepressor-like protein
MNLGCIGDCNPARALDRLYDNEKGITTVNTPGGKQKMSIVNESGMYWELEAGNITDALSRLDANEKGFDLIETLGGDQEVSIINESSMYCKLETQVKLLVGLMLMKKVILL